MSAFTSALGPFREVSTYHDAQGGRGRCLAVLNTSSRLAVGYTDGRLQLFDPTEGGHFQLQADSFCVHALAATPDGSLLACAGQDGVVLRQGDRGEPLAGKQGEVKSLAFHPDGTLLALGGMDGEVRFVSMQGEGTPPDFTAHPQFVEALAFSPDGQWLATAGLDGVTLWDWRTGERRHVLDVGVSCPKALVFTEEGAALAVGSEDGVIRRFDVESGGPRGALPPLVQESGVWTLALSPDGTVLAAGCEDGRIHLWGHTSGVLLRTLEGHEDAVLSLAWDGDALLASAGRDGSVRLWSSEEPSWSLPDGGLPLLGEEEDEEPAEDEDTHVHFFEEHEVGVTALAFHPGGGLLVSADASGHLKLRDLASGDEPGDLHAHEGEVSCVGFSPDGSLLVTASAAGGVRVFELGSGEERGHGTHPGRVVALAFHPTKPMLFTGGGGTVLFWDVRRGAQGRPLHEVPGEVTALAMRSDAGLLAVASSFGSIASISFALFGDGEPERRWTLPDTRVHSLAFSPDGSRLAVGLADGRVQLWEVASDAVVQELRCGEEEEDPVLFLAFSPDGAGLLASSAETQVLWRLEDGEVLFTSSGLYCACASALFAPDGDILLASTAGTMVRLEVLPLGEDD
jgi:WD40 repeat protein